MLGPLPKHPPVDLKAWAMDLKMALMALPQPLTLPHHLIFNGDTSTFSGQGYALLQPSIVP